MSEQVDEQAIVAKIEALFRKANHPNTGQAEREAFQAKALALMEKHRIATVDLDEDDPFPAEHYFGEIKGTYAKTLHQILGSVCRLYGCYTFFTSSGRPGDPTRTVYIFGHKRDAKRVTDLSKLFMEDARQQSVKMSPPSGKPDDTIRWRNSFLFGYANEISRRYAEAKKLLDQESTGWATTGNALVLVDRDKQVTKAYDNWRGRNRVGTARKSKMGFDGGGYQSGQEAARNSNIGRERIGGSGKQIGSGS